MTTLNLFSEKAIEVYVSENDFETNGHLYVITNVIWSSRNSRSRAYEIRNQFKEWFDTQIAPGNFLIELDKDSTSLGFVDRYYLRTRDDMMLFRLGFLIE